MLKKIFFIFSTFVISNCGFQKTGGLAGLCGGDNSAEAIFAAQVHPKLMTTCRNCHDSQIPSFTKGFTVEAVESAVMPYINLESPDNSTLVSRSNDGHCGTGCSNKEGLRDSIRDWAVSLSNTLQARTSCIANNNTNNPSNPIDEAPSGTTVKYTRVANDVSIPANLSTAFVQMDFPTSQFGNFGAQARLQVAIRVFATNPVYYEIGNIRLLSNTQPVKIENIRIRLVSSGSAAQSPLPTGSFNESLDFVSVNKTIVAAATTPVSSQTTVMARVPTGNNVVRIEVGKIALGTTGGGGTTTEVQTFNTVISPILNNRCNECHGVQGGPGQPSFDLTGDVSSDRSNALSNGKVNKTTPTSSLLYTKAIGQGHGGGNRLTVQSERTALLNWIASTP